MKKNLELRCKAHFKQGFANCNSVPNCVDQSFCCNTDLVCFGTSSGISIYNVRETKICAFINAHSDRVNDVKQIHTLPITHQQNFSINEHIDEIVSCSVDKTLKIHSFNCKTYEWHCDSTLNGHENSVTTFDTKTVSLNSHSPNSYANFIVSCSTDATVKIQTRAFQYNDNNQKYIFPQTCIQTIINNRNSACCYEAVTLSDALTLNNSTVLLLGIGGLDSKIEIHYLNLCSINFNDQESLTQSHFSILCTLNGHDDQIRSLHFSFPLLNHTQHSNSLKIKLASGAQDTKIRIWKIDLTLAKEKDEEEEKCKSDNVDIESYLIKRFYKKLGFNNKSNIFSNIKIEISFEALLLGHDDWIYSVKQQPPCWNEEKHSFEQPQAILSASIDRSVILQRPDKLSGGAQSNDINLGQSSAISPSKLLCGFYSAVFDFSGSKILAHSTKGSFYLQEIQFKSGIESVKQLCSVSGHYSPVTDCIFSSTPYTQSYNLKINEYLISGSLDKTVRVFGAKNKDSSDDVQVEQCRPQIHGYEINTLCNVSSRPHCYASGSAEKVIRVFEPTQSFYNTLLSNKEESIKREKIAYASVPELGLSNKSHKCEEENNGSLSGNDSDLAPFEQDLSGRLLWPEIQKLYGHGFELFCLTSTYKSANNKTLIASASSSKSKQHSSIRLWQCSGSENNSSQTEACRPLLGEHTLTIVQMEFSHQNQYLVSVSRDRSLCLFKSQSFEKLCSEFVNDSQQPSLYKLVFSQRNAHSRIIQTCSQSYDDCIFATGSRDTRIKIQTRKKQTTEIKNGKEEQQSICTIQMPCKNPVTAVTFSPFFTEEMKYCLAVGLENGAIKIYSLRSDVNFESMSYSLCYNFCYQISHFDAVKRIRQSPLVKKIGRNKFLLRMASCSSDYTVRLYEIEFEF